MIATHRTNTAAASGMIGATASGRSEGAAVFTTPARMAASVTPISERRHPAQRRWQNAPRRNTTHAVPIRAISGTVRRKTPLRVCCTDGSVSGFTAGGPRSSVVGRSIGLAGGPAGAAASRGLVVVVLVLGPSLLLVVLGPH